MKVAGISVKKQPIRFIVNEDNFNICFGADKDNPNKLTSVIDTLEPIILPESGYYKVCINTQEEIYSFERYIPELLQPLFASYAEGVSDSCE